jgi:hypothetical protein
MTGVEEEDKEVLTVEFLDSKNFFNDMPRKDSLDGKSPEKKLILFRFETEANIFIVERPFIMNESQKDKLFIFPINFWQITGGRR